MRCAPRAAIAFLPDTTLMRRALVIAPNWIGDALMAQPLFTLLKQLHPRIVIDALAPTWIVLPRAETPSFSEPTQIL
jgi:heptosyltransferase-2